MVYCTPFASMCYPVRITYMNAQYTMAATNKILDVFLPTKFLSIFVYLFNRLLSTSPSTTRTLEHAMRYDWIGKNKIEEVRSQHPPLSTSNIQQTRNWSTWQLCTVHNTHKRSTTHSHSIQGLQMCAVRCTYAMYSVYFTCARYAANTRMHAEIETHTHPSADSVEFDRINSANNVLPHTAPIVYRNPKSITGESERKIKKNIRIKWEAIKSKNGKAFTPLKVKWNFLNENAIACAIGRAYFGNRTRWRWRRQTQHLFWFRFCRFSPVPSFHRMRFVQRIDRRNRKLPPAAKPNGASFVEWKSAATLILSLFCSCPFNSIAYSRPSSGRRLYWRFDFR